MYILPWLTINTIKISFIFRWLTRIMVTMVNKNINKVFCKLRTGNADSKVLDNFTLTCYCLKCHCKGSGTCNAHTMVQCTKHLYSTVFGMQIQFSINCICYIYSQKSLCLISAMVNCSCVDCWLLHEVSYTLWHISVLHLVWQVQH